MRPAAADNNGAADIRHVSATSVGTCEVVNVEAVRRSGRRVERVGLNSVDVGAVCGAGSGENSSAGRWSKTFDGPRDVFAGDWLVVRPRCQMQQLFRNAISLSSMHDLTSDFLSYAEESDIELYRTARRYRPQVSSERL